MLGMHSARREHRDGVDILPRQKIIDLVIRGNAELRRDGVRTRANRVADSDEAGPVDMIAAQQFGMTLGDASATEQAKSDHCNSPHRDHRLTRIRRRRTASPV